MFEAYSPSLIAFYLIAFFIVAGAVLAVTSANLVRAALALAFSFFSVAGIFWLLGSPFLAVLQLVINAGAIPIVTIFIVMMTHSRMSRLRTPVTAVLGLIVAVPLVIAALRFATAEGIQVTPIGVERLGVELLRVRGQEVTLSTGESMTVEAGTLIPFEVASIILLVAFVGAIILARRESIAPAGTTQEERSLVDADA